MSFLESEDEGCPHQGNRSGKTWSAHLGVVLKTLLGGVGLAENRFLSPRQGSRLDRCGPGPEVCVLISTMDDSVALIPRVYFEKHGPGWAVKSRGVWETVANKYGSTTAEWTLSQTISQRACPWCQNATMKWERLWNGERPGFNVEWAVASCQWGNVSHLNEVQLRSECVLPCPRPKASPLLSPEQQQTLRLHGLWTWLSWERGSLGMWSPWVGGGERRKCCFLAWVKASLAYGLLKERDEGEKAGPFGGLWSGRAGNSCHPLARKPSPGFGICPASEIIKWGRQAAFLFFFFQAVFWCRWFSDWLWGYLIIRTNKPNNKTNKRRERVAFWFWGVRRVIWGMPRRLGLLTHPLYFYLETEISSLLYMFFKNSSETKFSGLHMLWLRYANGLDLLSVRVMGEGQRRNYRG